MANTLTRWLPATPARPHTVIPRLTMLEDRYNPAYLFVDFGDRFPAGTLTTTQGAFQDVANDAIPGNRVLGTTLVGNGNSFTAGTRLDIQAQTFTAPIRAMMMADVQRSFLPLNITVVELTSTPQTTADGRTVSGATSMNDVINTLRGGTVTSKDAYVFAATFVVDPLGSPRTYGSGGGGNSPGGTTLDTTDLTTGVNAHDDVAAVFTSNGNGFNFNTMNNIAHEAGHLFGHQHAISDNGASFSTAQRLLHQAEIMSYENTNNSSSSMFARFPMVRGDGNTNYEDIASRTGDLNSYDQFRTDANIGDNPLYRFISGTGAHDIITVTKSGANANVTVRAFADAAYTTAIAVPGGNGATSFTYTVPLDRTLLIYAGGSDDRIVLDGDLGVNVRVDGMLGTDTLIVDGKGAATAMYTPVATPGTSVDQSNYNGGLVSSYGGAIVIGATNITFENYETTSRLTVQNVTAVTVRSPGGADVFTLDRSGGQSRVSGTVNGGTAFVPLFLQTIGQLAVDAGNGDASAVTDSLVIDLTAGNPIPISGVSFAGGAGADTLRMTAGSFTSATHAITAAAAGGLTLSGSGPVSYTGTETIDLGGTPIAALTVSLPVAANALALEDDGTSGNSISRLRSTSGTPTFPTTLFRNPSGSLTLNAGGAADTVTVATLPDFTAGLTIGDDTNRFAAVTFNGTITFAANRSLTAFSSGNIDLPNATSDLTLSGSGAVSLTAAMSVTVASGASVSTTAGAITLSGNEQAGASNGTFVGVDVVGTVGATSGTVSVSGRGGTAGIGNQYGVYVHSGGTIFTTTSGAVIIVGEGGAAGGGSNHGVFVTDPGSAISSGSGSGGVTVVGTGGSGTASFGVWLTSGGTVASGGIGDLTVTTDSLYVETAAGFEGTLRAGAGGTRTATLQTTSAGSLINLGGVDVLSGSPLTLGLTDAELDRVSASTLVIGRTTTGGIRLTADIDRATTTAFRLVTGGDINSTLTAGRLNTSGGSLTLTAGTVTPFRTGFDFIASSVSFTAGTALAVVVTGPVADVGYPQLSVSGTLDLTGATLALSGGYIAAPGEAFTVVSATAVTGTFASPTAGSVVTLNGVNMHLFYLAGVPTLVVNRPPVGLSAGGPYLINRGDGLTVSAPAGTVDPDGEPFVYTWDVNGDGTFGDQAFGTVSDGGRTVTFTPAQALGIGLGVGARTRTLSVRATDGLTYGATTASTTLTINGLGLTISAFNGPSAGVEGGPLAFSAVATGPLPVTYNWTVLKNAVAFGTGTGDSFNFTPDDNGNYTVTLSVSDTGGAFDTATRTVSVANLAPVITAVSLSSGGVAAKQTVLSVAVTDAAGVNDPLTYAWVVTRNGVPVGSGTGPTLTFTPPTGGTYQVSVTVTDGDGGTATAGRTFTVPPRPIVVTSLAGTVRVRDVITGGVQVLVPFPTFLGGVNVASGDLNGDGVLDVVVAVTAGGGPHVRAFDGATMAEIASFFAFDVGFSGGVNVAAANGRIVVSAGSGGGPHVKVIDAARMNDKRPDGVIADTALVGNFFAFDVTFTGGVTVAAGDVNRDGVLDVVVGAAAGGGPHVKVIDGNRMNDVQNGVIRNEALLANFFAFDTTFTGGVTVAAANGRFAVGAGPGGEPTVRAFDGVSGAELANMSAYAGFGGGVRVGFADVNADTQPDLITAAGPGGGPHVRAFGLAPLVELESMFIADPVETRGVYV